ncbi:unnamed protein product [Cunninghamella blakesleeana]
MNTNQTTETKSKPVQQITNKANDSLALLQQISNDQQKVITLLSNIYNTLDISSMIINLNNNNNSDNNSNNNDDDNDDDRTNCNRNSITSSENENDEKKIIKRPRDKYRSTISITKSLIIQHLVPYVPNVNIDFEKYLYLYLEDCHKVTLIPCKSIKKPIWKKASILYLFIYHLSCSIVDKLKRTSPNLMISYSSVPMKKRLTLIHALENQCKKYDIPLHLAENHWLANHFIFMKFKNHYRSYYNPNGKIMPHKKMIRRKLPMSYYPENEDFGN